MSNQKAMRIGEIRGNLWSLLDARFPDAGLEVQRLQEEANELVLSLCGVSKENLGNCCRCSKRLTLDTVDKDAVGILRIDSNYKLWCENCTK